MTGGREIVWAICTILLSSIVGKISRIRAVLRMPTPSLVNVTISSLIPFW